MQPLRAWRSEKAQEGSSRENTSGLKQAIKSPTARARGSDTHTRQLNSIVHAQFIIY